MKVLKMWYQLSIKFKLLVMSLIIIVFVSGIGGYSCFVYEKSLQEYARCINNYYDINQLAMEFSDNQKYISALMRDPSAANLALYRKSTAYINILLEDIHEGINSKATYLAYKPISVSIDQCFKAYDRAIAQQSSDNDQYFLQYYDGVKIGSYINGYIQQLLNTTLEEGMWFYNQQMVPHKQNIRYQILAVTFLIGVLSVVYAVSFSDNITLPIRRMAAVSNRISQGDFDVPDIVTEQKDEVSILADSFNHMKSSIKEMVNSLREKAIIERELAAEQVKNMEIRESLRESELLALQSQIKPHFLFNTLNSIAATATLEEAEDTKKLIMALSKILRHQIGQPNRVTTLEAELALLQDYLFIEQYRFRDRLEVEISCEVDAGSYYVPAFTLQPLVENSIHHGLTLNSGTGQLRVEVTEQEGLILIRIIDNGVGMTQEKAQELMEGRTGRNEGIGIPNVINRLDRYFDGESKVQIESREGSGTVITLQFPARKNPMSYV